MNILLVNASPKGKRSNTLHITQAFLKGMMSSGGHELHTFMLKDKHIEYCSGCFHCWSTRDGSCVFQDDMSEYKKLYMAADVVIFSTPIYFFGPPARLKNLLDRTLPFYLPEIIDRKDQGQKHNYRWDIGNKKIVLIATCGFYSYENNTEPLVRMFDICYGDQYECIICPEGTLFSLEIFNDSTKAYLASAEKAGKEMAGDGRISEATKRDLVRRTYEKDDYLILANQYWIQTDENMTEKEKKLLLILKRSSGMPVLFDSSLFGDAPTVIQMDFPAFPYTVQLHLSRAEKKAVEDPKDFLPYHLRLEMDPDHFISIATRKKSSAEGDRQFGSSHASLTKLAMMAVRLQKRGIQKVLRISGNENESA